MNLAVVPSQDPLELSRLYLGAAAAERRRADEPGNSSQVPFFIKQAIREFILQPATPFNGGPPSLLVVGGSDPKDGPAFVGKTSKRRRA